MDRVPIHSNELASIGYDPTIAVMEIEFQNGVICQYFGVSPYLHETLVNSKTKDSFFHQTIEKEIFCYLPVTRISNPTSDA